MTDAPVAELSSLTTGLEELSRRIGALGEDCAGGDLDMVAQELYEVERSLDEGLRRLTRLTKSLGGV